MNLQQLLVLNFHSLLQPHRMSLTKNWLFPCENEQMSPDGILYLFKQTKRTSNF